jgi:CheY-like chemotaxis protein
MPWSARDRGRFRDQQMAFVLALTGALVAAAIAAWLVARRRAGEPASPGGSGERPGEAAQASLPARYVVKPLRILVVDDNELVGSTVARLLEVHDVTTATSSEAALSALALDAGFDAILYSLAMPGMSGVKFAATLAERHPALRPRVAFLVNGSSTPETIRLLSLSDIPWVTKPLRYAQLAICVSTVAPQPITP